MVSGIISRILHVIYPVLVLGVALTAWSSSSLSDVRTTPPPIGDGFNFFWNPILSTQNSCTGDKIQKLNRECFNSGGPENLEQLSNNQNQKQIKTN